MQFRLELRSDVVNAFAAVTGDRSSIHVDAEFARRTRFRRPIAHGLLPVSCVLLRVMPEREQGTWWLNQISCRFLNPAYIGDNLELILGDRESGDGLVSYRFDVLNADSGSTVAVGSVKVAQGPPLLRALSLSDQGELFFAPLKENSFKADELELGRAETVDFQPTPAAIRILHDIFTAQPSKSGRVIDSNLFDVNLAATLPVSALIGMRLPGRFATFTDLDAKFESAVTPNAKMTLRGEVEKLMTATGRVRIGLEWVQGGRVVGRGLAAAIINRPSPVGIACRSLNGSRLATGIVGKVALVTGASRGIGEATAKLLGMHGAKVAVHYFLGGKDAAAIVDDIRENGGTALAVCADLRDEATVQRMFETVQRGLGQVDILVNNAVGNYSPKPLESLTARDYLEELSISLFGLHTCCKLALPYMRSKRRGKIINLGSIATEVPVSGQNKYITAKSAVVGYTRSLAVEVARDNVQVNVVLPRMTETTLIASLPQGHVAKLIDESPTRRLLQPLDVAKAIVFLASEWADSISGQKLVLNQGEAPFL
jgi:3-oxoacyl-[acyl-carrier protein] reductase